MRIALSVGLRVPLIVRIVPILSALSVTAARLHAHSVDTVDATQEVNRCLRLVNMASSRRHRSSARAPRTATASANDSSTNLFSID